MSFDNATTCYIHLVSYPSCWLPPPPAIKLMVVGLGQSELDSLVATIQETYPDHNFAIYHNPEFDSSSVEHLDWLLINSQHCHGTWVQVNTCQDLAIASCLRVPGLVGAQLNLNAYLTKLADTAALRTLSVIELLEKVVKERSLS